MARDDFDQKTKQLMADRVGHQCANPNCRQQTSGPQVDPLKALNVGVAAHITAASPSGPRYDDRMTEEERTSPDNGIWLCQICAKLIDNDPQAYPVDLLRRWRYHSEGAARLAIESRNQSTRLELVADRELIKFYRQCFDRSAFQDPFAREGSTEAFDRAIEDTITAINTGCLRARDGVVLSQAKGKSYLERSEWRDRMDVIVELLRAIRSRYDDAIKGGSIYTNALANDRMFYDFRDPELVEWMDQTRNQILEVFAQVCEEAEVAPLPPLTRRFRRYW